MKIASLKNIKTKTKTLDMKIASLKNIIYTSDSKIVIDQYDVSPPFMGGVQPFYLD
jgi:hypothetical protein